MSKVGIYIDTKWYHFIFDFLEINKFDMKMINKAVDLIEQYVGNKIMPKTIINNNDPWYKA